MPAAASPLLLPQRQRKSAWTSLDDSLSIRVAGKKSVARVPPLLGAIGLTRQSLEAPERDRAGLATLLADERLVTEHEARAPERLAGRGVLAMRTSEREIPRAPAQHKIS